MSRRLDGGEQRAEVPARPAPERKIADPVVSQIRERITNTDRLLVETINERIKLVEQLRRHKERHALPFLDPQREEWMLSYLTRANRGPLSAEGLAELYAHVLELTKRETAHTVEA